MSNAHTEALDYLEANLRIFPLYPLIHGKCACTKHDCISAGKHPARTNWTTQQVVDPDLLEIWFGIHSQEGYGWALDEEHIVIDVDPRNGGMESLTELQKDIGIDLFDVCQTIIKTGGGGWHFIFKKKDNFMLGWKMPSKYKGIDIKQYGGFVVTAGSLHASGNEYSWHSADKSNMIEMAILPESIELMLTKVHQEHRQAMQDAGMGDLFDIADMLDWIPNEEADYDYWLRVGMAVHHATAGSMEGLQLFHNWGKKSSKYDPADTDRRWHSFGKRVANLATTGTLVYLAKEHHWTPGANVEVLNAQELKDLKDRWYNKAKHRINVPSISDDADIDIFSPPGLLGSINDYVYACSVFPNRNLSLACSLSVLTNAIGRKFHWPGRFSSIQPNLLVLCIAGSSVGKDAILGAAHRLLSIIGLEPVIHGRIKSDKDLLDSLERSQYAMYFNDEFGYFLKRVNNAMRSGNAAYLEGIIGTIMEVFTKGDKSVLLDVSRKADIQERYATIANKAAATIQDGPKGIDTEKQKAKIERANVLMKKFSGGLPNPFLSMFTTATPRTMELAFSGEATENGFLSRALTFYENETNPRPKHDFEGVPPIPMGLEMALKAITFERDECVFGRIDSFEQKSTPIAVDTDALVFVERAIEYFFELAETQKESGLESLPRRALDSIVKVCIALAAQECHLTLPMARYAVKLVRCEMDKKIRRVNSTEGMESRDKDEKMDAVSSKICEVCETAEGELIGTIQRRCKTSRVNPADITKLVGTLVETGKLESIDTGRLYAGNPVIKYRTTQKGNA